MIDKFAVLVLSPSTEKLMLSLVEIIGILSAVIGFFMIVGALFADSKKLNRFTQTFGNPNLFISLAVFCTIGVLVYLSLTIWAECILSV